MPGHMFWTLAPLGCSLSSSDAPDQTSEEEEQGDVCAQVHLSQLERALDQIGLREDEMGLGPPCGNSGPQNEPHDFSPYPAEGDADDGSDHGSSAAMLDTDLDVSEEEPKYPHSPAECPTEAQTPDKVPKEKFYHCPDSQPHAPSRAPSLPLLLSQEELASSPQIMDEILPEIWSQSSSESSPQPGEADRGPQTETGTVEVHGAVSKIPVKVSVTPKRPSSTEDTRSSSTRVPKARPRSSKSRPGSEGKQSKASLFSFSVPCTPRADLSKVEPRVHFPKDSYTPPKSRCSLRSGSLPPEPPLVFMSPADIVSTVLFSPADGPDPEEDEAPAALSILPPDFRSRKQAVSLMNELQEDYYRLKLKYAEAETTIDRLRLQATVNLYSDPPEPRLPLHSGVIAQASRAVTLDFPQRAAVSPPSPPQSAAGRQQHGSPLTSTSTSERNMSDFDRLSLQAQLFHQIVEAFERNLQTAEGQTEEQTEIFQEMLQKLAILERDYIFAKKEHKRLQRQGASVGDFDPERELESLIYQCGVQMDELKEQVQQEQSRSVAPPSDHATPPRPLQTPPSPGGAAAVFPQHSRSPPASSSSSVRGVLGVAHRLHQQKVEACDGAPHAPQQIKGRTIEGPAASALSAPPSAAEDRKAQSPSPDPVGSGAHDQPDSTKLFHSRKEVAVPLVRDLSGPSPSAAGLQWEESRRLSKANTSYGSNTREADPSSYKSPVRSAQAQDVPPRARSTSTPDVGRSFSPEAFGSHTQSHGPSRGRSVAGPSHSSSLSSLRDAPHTTDLKRPRERPRQFQDGLISPETDSGFLGSEECRLTPAAAASPVHQREPTGVAPVSASPGPSLSRRSKEGPAVRPKPSPRSRRGEKTRRSLAAQLHRQRADREGQSGHYSAHGSSTSEEDRSERSSGPSLFTSGPSLSSCGPSHRPHGDPLKDPNTVGEERFDEVFDELQGRMLRLRDTMDWFMKDSSSTLFSRSDRHPALQRSRRDREQDVTRSQTDLSGAVSSNVSQTDLSGAVSSNVSQTDLRSAVSSKVTQTDLRSAVSCKVSQTDLRRAVSSKVSQTDLRGAVSSNVSQTDLRRAVSSKVSQTDLRGAVSSNVSQTDLRRAVSSKVSQTDPCSPQHVSRLTQTSADPRPRPETDPRQRPETDPWPRPETDPRQRPETDPWPRPETDPRQRPETDPWPQRDSFSRSDRAVPCVSVCPRPLLLCPHSLPVHLSPGQSEVRSRPQRLREGRSSRRVPADRLSSLDEPLSRALRATRSMERTSRHMVLTLASGLQLQRTLAPRRQIRGTQMSL